jgi:hypothetical protein
VDAISQDRGVPAGQEAFVADNARFFAEPLPGRDEPLGNAGGSAATGPIGVDTELVAGWDTGRTRPVTTATASRRP